MFHFKRIRPRLTFWFLIITILPLIAGDIIIYHNFKQTRKEDIFNKLEAVRDLKVEELNNWLDERIGDIQIIASDHNVRALENKQGGTAGDINANAAVIASSRELLRRYLDIYNSFYEIQIVNPHTREVIICTNEIHEGQRSHDETNFSKILRDRGIYIRDIYYSMTENRPSMSLFIPVISLNKENTIFGIVIARINLEVSLYELLLHRTGMGETGETLIVNKDAVALNELLWYRNAPLNLKITATSAVDAAQGKTGIAETKDYRGEMVLAAYTHMPRTGWGFVAKQDLSEVYAPLHQLRRWMISIGMVIVLLVITAAFRVSKRLSDPIKLLHKGSEIIGGGNLDYKVSSDDEDEIGQLSRAFDNMTLQLKKTHTELEDEINERRKAEVKLQIEKEKLKKYLDISAVMVVLINADQSVLLINKKGCEILGYREEEIVGRNWFETFLPERIRDEVKDIHSQLLSGDIAPVEYYENEVLTKSGEERQIAWYNTVFRDEQGKITQTLASGVDISERKKAEMKIRKSLAEKELLLKEIHHRVKNNMSVISSLLNLQSQKVTDTRYQEMFKDSVNRIRIMALIHEKLYRSKDLSSVNFNEYIKDIVSDMYTSYGLSSRDVVMETDVESVSLEIDMAIPCGLIISELISNALKYAFPEGKKGNIKVSLKALDKDEFELKVSDNGVGMPENLDFRSADSLGLFLVNALTTQIRGNVELNRANGTEFTVRFKKDGV